MAKFEGTFCFTASIFLAHKKKQFNLAGTKRSKRFGSFSSCLDFLGKCVKNSRAETFQDLTIWGILRSIIFGGRA